MKNKQLFATFALVLSSVLVAGCSSNPSSTTSSSDKASSSTSSSSESSSTSASASSSSSSASSSSSLPEINLDDSELYYLKGTFHGTTGTLDVTGKEVTLTSENTSITLKPTSVKDEEIDSSLTTLTLGFDELYNDGTAYRAYVDLDGDGFLHLEKLVSGSYVTYGTYQPDIALYQGVYSAYGSSDMEDVYTVITNDFDAVRNGYYNDHVYQIYWSNEQSYIGRTRIRGTKEDSYITYEEYDSDGDGWGESELIKEENRVRLYDRTWEMDNAVTDFGLIQCLEIFDGTSVIGIGADLEEGILYYGEEEGTLEIKNDEKGFYILSTLKEKETKIRFFHHYVTFEVGSEVKVYPINDTSEMAGTFTDKTNTISYVQDFDTEEYKLTFNDEETDFTYVIHNNRKAISFTKDGVTYIVTPEKSETAIKVSVNGKETYYLNDEEFASIFANTYVTHSDGKTSTFVINDDLTFTFGETSGQGTYVYSHGYTYPSLKMGDMELKIINSTLGLYDVSIGGKTELAYSKATLDSVYGTYSSNGVDSLTIDEQYVTIGDKKYEYDFSYYLPSSSSWTQFAVSLKGTEVETLVACNLAGTVVTIEDDVESKYYVSKDIFTTIAGTYSAYGKYGIENIKISSEGKLTLDTTNEDGTGLDRDVEYPYYIITNEDYGYIAEIIFTYKGTSIALDVYSDHVSIGTLNYYESTLTTSWGVYTDEAKENIVLIRDGDIYVNGTYDSISSYEEDENTITFTTTNGSLVITKGDTFTAVYTSEETTINLTRTLSYTDYSKFNGTYTINEKEVTFGLDDTGLSYQAVIDGFNFSFSSMNVSIVEGAIRLEISDYSGKYYLTLNLETEVVTTSFEADSSIPTPPPFARF